MTATLLAASTVSTAGETTEPLPWAAPVLRDASTYLELGTVANSALRDVLAHFASGSEPSLRLSETTPGTVVLRCALDRSVDQRIRVFMSGSATDLRPHLEVRRWLASTNGELLETHGAGALCGTRQDAVDQRSDAATDSVVPTRASDVVEVIEWLAEQLGVPDGDIIRAARIKRRNWHNWKNGRRPRLETQGQLWALLNSIQALSDMFDGDPAAWFKVGGTRRRDLLASGQHRKIVQEALKEAAIHGELTNGTRNRRRHQSAAGYFE